MQVLEEFGNLPETAKGMGLEVKYIDERYNLEKSTQAACDFILKAKTNLVLDMLLHLTIEAWLVLEG
jgi:hypothetical protein